MTKACLLCGVSKQDDEAILCDPCMDYFNEVQMQTLQEQLNAIKRGLPKSPITMRKKRRGGSSRNNHAK
jgi:hypothetical protein